MFVKTLITLWCILKILAIGSRAEIYDTKYDNIDLDEILQNERLLRNYVKCLEREGPCTPDGKELRETLPDAIATDCLKCSETQKKGSEKVMHYLIDNKPSDWDRLEKIYDPEGNYRKTYLESRTTSTEESNKIVVEES